ncbi:MAG: ABC transporter substrate-binding protein [Aggregatilineales bacterium]
MTMLRHHFLRVVSFVIVFAIALSFAGPIRAQGTKITFLTPPWGVPPNQDALNAFQQKSGITVEIQSVQTSDLFSRVQIAAASNQAAADVIFLTEEAPSNVIATGNMMDLSSLIASSPDLDMKDFNKVDFFTLNNQVFGIPTYQQLVMMDYNADRLAKAGINVPPKTWAELRQDALTIRDKGIDQYPIAFGATDWSWYLMALSMGDPMFDKDMNPVFADKGSKARDAMKLLLSFFSDKLISPDMLTASTTPHTLFWSGTGTFHQGWQGSVAVGNNPKTSKQAPNVKYLLLPEVGNTWSFPAAIGIAKNSANAAAAWQFIKWYVGPDVQTDIYNAVGLYPSRTSVADALSKAGKIDGADVIAEQSKHVNELPRYVVWWGPFAQKVAQAVLSAAQTGTDSDQVIDGLATQWNALKAEYK